MTRLAWFTPLPPARSGIAAYNAELLPLLAPRYQIDAFTWPRDSHEPEADSERDAAGRPFAGGARCRVFSAHDFLWRHSADPYDLIVYQLGNAACHDFMWPHLARYPGLVVLHDGQLHHERSRALLSRGRFDDYRAEFRYNHPDAPDHLPELVASTLGGALYYLYPMVRWVVRTARLVAVHSPGLARELTSEHPGVEVRTIRHGMIDPLSDGAARAAAGIRERYGIPPDALLFAAFGLVTPEKRISAALRAVAALVPSHPDVHLLLAGGTVDYYDALAEARSLGIADRVTIAGYIADEALPACVLAADICLCLRWPTSRETSGTWIRAIGCGKPTITTDLAHNAGVPALEPRTWQRLPAPPAPGAPETDPAPITVAVDILDEDETLRLAMSRLASDAAFRRQLGAAARAYWQAHHTMAGAVEDNATAIERALCRPIPHVRGLPAHLVDDGLGLARRVVDPFGVKF